MEMLGPPEQLPRCAPWPWSRGDGRRTEGQPSHTKANMNQAGEWGSIPGEARTAGTGTRREAGKVLGVCVVFPFCTECRESSVALCEVTASSEAQMEKLLLF